MKVKICGLTNSKDANLSHELGADYLGFILCQSPRQILAQQLKMIVSELPQTAQAVAVFKNEVLAKVIDIATQIPFQAVQLHGAETPDYVRALKKELPYLTVFKVIPVDNETLLTDPSRYDSADALIFDSAASHLKPQMRSSFNLSLKEQTKTKLPVYIAGGVSSENLISMIKLHTPNGFDLSSSVEKSVGIKDPEKLFNFFNVLKGYL